MPTVVDAAIVLLNDIDALLRILEASAGAPPQSPPKMTSAQTLKAADDLFSFESKLIPGSTVGKHCRHLLDHFDKLLTIVERPPDGNSGGEHPVDYDARVRNVDSERRVAAAKLRVTAIAARLREAVPNGEGDEPGPLNKKAVSVKFYLDAGSANATLTSTVGREVWFVTHHAIHHAAMIKVICSNELGISLPPEFGVAPSTLRHITAPDTKSLI
ncbi:hypothetical protein DFJ73DRAFT_665791 [Zopfochytrium polystomum]|nr:hypothetical protein DFJ73DRAFT_665791 [Zopfochytrium polystomum]